MARTAALPFFQNPAHDRESNPHAILIRILFFYASETVEWVRFRFKNIRYHSKDRIIPEDPIYIVAEARNHTMLHSFGDKLLETSYLLPRIPGIPASIFFQRVAAYTLTEVICDFLLSLKTDHTHLTLSITTSLRHYVTYTLEKALFNKRKRFRKS